MGFSSRLYFSSSGVKRFWFFNLRKEQCHVCGWDIYTVHSGDFCKTVVFNFFSKTSSWFFEYENNLCREHLAKSVCFDRVDWYTYTFNPLWMSYLKSLQNITVCLSANAHWDLKPPFWLLSFLRVTLADSSYCTTESCGDFFFLSLVLSHGFTWCWLISPVALLLFHCG